MQNYKKSRTFTPHAKPKTNDRRLRDAGGCELKRRHCRRSSGAGGLLRHAAGGEHGEGHGGEYKECAN